LFLTNICPNGIIEPYPNLSHSLSYLFFIPDQQQPTSEDKQRLQHRFDEIFGLRYPHHYGLNLAMQQFCANKKELLRVLDAPQLPLHTLGG
jgi:hypothetical protein